MLRTVKRAGFLLALRIMVSLQGNVVAADALPSSTAPSAPTYHQDIGPILRENCRGCHRKGQVGPFAFDKYEQARKRAHDIAELVAERRMPPWKPKPGLGPKLKHDRSMAQADIDRVVAWVEAGAPEGRPESEGSSADRDDEAWSLGTPDLVVEMTEPFPVPASGRDPYRCFVIPTALPEDVYITAAEFHPGNRRVVHHMTCWVDVTRQGRRRDAADPGPGYAQFAGPGVPVQGDLGGWAAGSEPNLLPDGIGRLLPRGGDVILQIHYHPSGKPETDRSRIGFYFARKPVKQTLHWNGAGNHTFRIPAGLPRVEVKASWVVPVDVLAIAVSPHMHHLGRDIRMDVVFPDGREQLLVFIEHWDANWQNTYYFETPIELPKGSVVHTLAHFDNSENNPRNPNHPPKSVTYGEGSKDEMCVGYIGVVKRGQDLTRPGNRDDLFDIFVRQRKDEERNVRRLRGR